MEADYNVPIDTRGTIIPIEEFKKSVESGTYKDYNGMAYPVRNGFFSKKHKIRPSRMEEIPEDATHVIWY